MRDLTLRIKPRVTVWYHQMMNLVTSAPAATCAWRRSTRAPARMRHGAAGPAAGHGHELAEPHGARRDGVRGRAARRPAVARARLRRHAGAVLSVARASRRRARVAAPIPFGAERKRQMRAYARRHYGIDSFCSRPR